MTNLFIEKIKSNFLNENTDSLDNLMYSASSGNTEAQFMLGKCYAKGLAIEKNIAKAKEWFLKAAKKGHILSQYSLSVLYLNLDGTDKTSDPVLAVKWLKKAVSKGDADSESMLGYCYLTGTGIKQDYDKAIKWLAKSFATSI